LSTSSKRRNEDPGAAIANGPGQDFVRSCVPDQKGLFPNRHSNYRCTMKQGPATRLFVF
jgi:hypothetical protein